MKQVTDPEILRQLNGGGKPVTDPILLRQLNGEDTGPPLQSSHGKKQVEPWKRTVSNFARPALEGAGAALGGIVGAGAGLATGPGAPVASPTLGLAGGTLGYAMGKRGADILDETFGIRHPLNLRDTAVETVNDLATGAAYEMGGPILGVAAGSAGRGAVRGAKALKEKTLPLIAPKKTAERDAAEILQQFARPEDAANLQQSAELARRVPGLRYTPGMGAKNRDLVSLERGTISSSAGKPGLEGAQDRTARLLEGNVGAVSSKLKGISQGNVDDFTGTLAKQQGEMESARTSLAGADRQRAGLKALEEIDTAQEPVKRAMGELEAQIPDYPLPLRNTRETLANLSRDKKLSRDQQRAVSRISDYLSGQTDTTTHAAFGINRTLNDDISKAFASGNDSEAVSLLAIKDALRNDLEAVGGAVRTGAIKTHNGSIVYPEKLAQEFEDNARKLAFARAESAPDIGRMTAVLRERNVPVMRVSGETEQAFHQRITKDFQRLTGESPPTTASGSEKYVNELTERNAQIAKILGEVEPGQDVAAAMRAYNSFASKEYFGRFGTTAIKQATRKGSQAAGTQTRPENITALFSSPTGADDLIRAVGREKAGTIMRDHYRADFSKVLSSNPSDAQLFKWLSVNRQSLGKLGILDEMTVVVKGQAGHHELTKITGTDTESLFESLLSGGMHGGGTTQQRKTLAPILARIKNNPKATEGLRRAFADYLEGKIVRPLAADRQGFGRVADQLQKLDPAIKMVFTPDQVRQLQDVRRAVALTQQMTAGSPLGGSQTQELLKASERIADGRKASPILSATISAVIGGTGFATGHGVVGVGAAAAVQAFRETAKKQGDEALRGYFMRAMFDPEYAKTLVQSTKGMTPQLEKKINAQVLELAKYRRAAAIGGGSAAIDARTDSPLPTEQERLGLEQ